MDSIYWFVSVGDGGYTVDDENYEKIKNAILKDLKGVEVTTCLGFTTFLNVSRIVAIDESTPEIRDTVYLWNKHIDEDVADRKKRLGTAADFDS